MSPTLAHWFDLAKERGIRIIVIAVIALILNRMLRAFTSHMIIPAKTQTRVAQAREQQTRTMAGVLYSAGSLIILLGAILMILPEFGFSVTPVAAVAGLGSLALGFGAQYLVRDVINGFFIVFEDQYGVGDTVRINDETGRVEHITLRRTILRNAKGAIVTIPNGQIGLVANLSRDWSQYFLDVNVPGEADVPKALAALEKAAAGMREDQAWTPLLVDGPRVLGIEALALTGATLRLQFRSAPARNDDVARELRRRILLEAERAGVPLSGGQRVTLVGGKGYPEFVQDKTESP
ncbi:MAG TPA: mechanosensitive ion channel family protein [Candidatus Acidoferrales bacterium]|nr:mechanosensitive ion channel family protein [Candidatus Acidoferrales bacterium]